MSDVLQLGTTPIHLKDDEFSNGFQVGYLHFKTQFLGKSLSDELLYTVLAQTFVNVHHTDRYNAGYLSGFFTALLEPPGKTPLFSIINRQPSGSSLEASR